MTSLAPLVSDASKNELDMILSEFAHRQRAGAGHPHSAIL